MTNFKSSTGRPIVPGLLYNSEAGTSKFLPVNFKFNLKLKVGGRSLALAGYSNLKFNKLYVVPFSAGGPSPGTQAPSSFALPWAAVTLKPRMFRRFVPVACPPIAFLASILLGGFFLGFSCLRGVPRW